MEVKESIVSSVRLIVYFICITLLGSIVLAALYMVYTLCANLVAGQTLHFNVTLFLEGVILFAPFVLMLTAMMLTFSLIRHPVHGMLPIVVYTALYVLAWLVLIPRTVLYDTSLLDKYGVVTMTELPSGGYFRPDGEGNITYYAAVDDSDGSVSGLYIRTKGNGRDVHTFSGLRLGEKTATFTDSLIQGSLDMPPVLSLLAGKVSGLSVLLKKCASRSFVQWLCFASMGLALLAVVGIRSFSQWRLVNVVLVICVTAGVIIFNVLGYTNPAFAAVEKGINDVFNKVSLFRALNAMGNMFVILCNIIVAVLLVVTGIICAKRSVLQRGLEQEEDEELL